MARYFTIMAELRGCYSDNDSAFILRAETRRELKAALASEAAQLRDAGAVGLNKRAIANLAARAWKRPRPPRTGHLADVAPYRFAYQSGWPMGLMVYQSDRAEYLAQSNEWES